VTRNWDPPSSVRIDDLVSRRLQLRCRLGGGIRRNSFVVVHSLGRLRILTDRLIDVDAVDIPLLSFVL